MVKAVEDIKTTGPTVEQHTKNDLHLVTKNTLKCIWPQNSFCYTEILFVFLIRIFEKWTNLEVFLSLWSEKMRPCVLLTEFGWSGPTMADDVI